jgi:hypothetical protein
MGIGSGLGGSVGIAEETTYGTYATPTKFFEVNKSEIKKVKNVVQGGGLAAGRLVQPGTRRVQVSEAGTGSLEMEVTSKAMGVWLRQIFGGLGTITQQGATAAWLQSYGLADNVGRMVTAQNGVPDTTGTVRPYTGLGGKVTKGEFSCGVDELLTVGLDVDFQKISEAQSLAAPSYVTGLVPFHFGQMAVKLGTFGAETAVNGVKKAIVAIERGQATDRFYAQGGGANPAVKAEPLVNEWVKVSGSLDVDLVNKADFADRFAADASTSMVLEWVGPLIASTFYSTFRIKLPMIFVDGDTPVLSDAGVTTGSVPFTAQFDLTNAAVSCEYISTDTTV